MAWAFFREFSKRYDLHCPFYTTHVGQSELWTPGESKCKVKKCEASHFSFKVNDEEFDAAKCPGCGQKMSEVNLKDGRTIRGCFSNGNCGFNFLCPECGGVLTEHKLPNSVRTVLACGVGVCGFNN